MAYPTQDNYRDAYRYTQFDDDDGNALIRRALAVGIRKVENRCRRTFDQSESQARMFTQHKHADLLYVDPFYGAATLADADGNAITKFTALPHNSTQFNKLRATDGLVWKVGDTYTLTATYGMAVTPDVVTEMILEIARIYLLQSPRSRGDAALPGEVEGAEAAVSERADKLIDDMLSSYKLYNPVWIDR